jgi:hypothetical protein
MLSLSSLEKYLPSFLGWVKERTFAEDNLTRLEEDEFSNLEECFRSYCYWKEDPTNIGRFTHLNTSNKDQFTSLLDKEFSSITKCGIKKYRVNVFYSDESFQAMTRQIEEEKIMKKKYGSYARPGPIKNYEKVKIRLIRLNQLEKSLEEV